MTGWFRISRRRKWHRFAVSLRSDFHLEPVCGKALLIARVPRPRLRQRDELPPHALLCRGCTAVPEPV